MIKLLISKPANFRNFYVQSQRVFSSMGKLQNVESRKRPEELIKQGPENITETKSWTDAAELTPVDRLNVAKQVWEPSPTKDKGQLIANYKKLSKFRLTSLVVITTMAGYAVAPAPFDPISFLLCSLGTGLVSAAANSINQFHEVPFDSQMSRTKSRVLVTGRVTPLHAMGFALFSSISGLSMLYYGVNGLTAALGLGNLVLYTSIYTPLKRVSIINTWVGSAVGAIPPLIGWAGCCGCLDSGAWVLAGLLYAWQFPHFNALSWNLRQDYSRAGYQMMSVTNPELCRRTALRYTFVISFLSCLAPLVEVTNYWFALETFPLNGYFCYLVTGRVTPLHAMGFALFSSISGLSMLYYGVNGLTAALGLGNLVLYTSIYTPLKRVSIINTWVGSAVGAIPPLIGWAGCCGCLDSGAWVLAGLLYAWQFPHFNALSWNLRQDYSRAGYQMMSVTNPELCRRTALRYTFVISFLSCLAPLVEVTNYWFALETFPLNGYFCYLESPSLILSGQNLVKFYFHKVVQTIN